MKRIRIATLMLTLASAMPLLHAEGYKAQGVSPILDGDLSWILTVHGTPNETACASLVFDRRDAQNYKALRLTSGSIFLVKVEHGVESFLGTGVPFEPFPGDRYEVMVRRRASALSLFVDGARVLGVSDRAESRAGGFGCEITGDDDSSWVHISAGEWVKAAEARLDLRFTPESATSAGAANPNQGRWRVLSGAWRLSPAPGPDAALSPAGRYAGRGGLALVGGAGWDNYVAQAAVRLGGPRASAGLAFYALSTDRYHLLRLVGEGGAERLELVTVADGKESVIESRPTVLAPGQWCELKVAVVDDAVKAYVDGQWAFVADVDCRGGGQVGFWAAGAEGARFDDLRVRSLRLSRADFLGDRDGRVVGVFAHGPAGLDAGLPMRKDTSEAALLEGPLMYKRGGWHKEEALDGVVFESNSDFYGNVTFQWAPQRPVMAGASASLAICVEEGDVLAHRPAGPDAGLPMRKNGVVNSGYALTLLYGDDTSVSLSLARAGRELRTIHVDTAGNAAAPPAPPKVELSRSGSLITASLNGQPVIEFSDPAPLGGTRVRFQTDLPFVDAPLDLRVINSNECAEHFTEAPVNWVSGGGDWEVFPASRLFSPFPWIGNVPGGRQATALPGFGPSILWNKGSYAGDLTLEYDVCSSPFRSASPFPPNFNAVLCADGRDLAGGYCLMFSPPVMGGQPDWPIRLLRLGKVVAESRRMLDDELSPSAEDRERLTPLGGWWRLRIQKRGGFLRFFVDDDLALEYREKNPLTGTRLGLWTLGAPMAVSRVGIAWSQYAAPGPVFASERAPAEEAAREDSSEGTIKVTNALCGGPFDVSLIRAPVRIALPPPAKGREDKALLSFDLKTTPDVAVNLYLAVEGQWYAVPITGPEEHPQDVTVLSHARLAGRGAWRTTKVDLAGVLRRAFPKAGEVEISDIRLGNAGSNWRFASGLFGNRIGSSYWVRDVVIHAK